MAVSSRFPNPGQPSAEQKAPGFAADQTKYIDGALAPLAQGGILTSAEAMEWKARVDGHLRGDDHAANPRQPSTWASWGSGLFGSSGSFLSNAYHAVMAYFHGEGGIVENYHRYANIDKFQTLRQHTSGLGPLELGYRDTQKLLGEQQALATAYKQFGPQDPRTLQAQAAFEHDRGIFEQWKGQVTNHLEAALQPTLVDSKGELPMMRNGRMQWISAQSPMVAQAPQGSQPMPEEARHQARGALPVTPVSMNQSAQPQAGAVSPQAYNAGRGSTAGERSYNSINGG